MLADQQVAAGVQRGFVLHGGLLGDALAQQRRILRAVKTAEEDSVPAGQLGNVVKPAAVFNTVSQRLAFVGGGQAADNGVHAALQKLRRQDMQQLGGAGGVGVHVAAHVQPLFLRPVQQLQGPGYFFAPVVPAHGLQVADVQGDPQFPGHQQHLLDGIADARALLPHMDGEGDILPRDG